MFEKWLAQKQHDIPKDAASGGDSTGQLNLQFRGVSDLLILSIVEEGAETVVSSLTASVWKIKCKPGDVIKSGEDVLIILEAMKTEVNVEAGEENVGRTVVGFGKGTKEGAAVASGDVLVILK